MMLRISTLLFAVLCFGIILTGCSSHESYPDSESASQYYNADFVMYTMNKALYFAFDEEDEVKLLHQRQTDYDCAFLADYFAETENYWYTVTSEKTANEYQIVQINKMTLTEKLSDVIADGGYSAMGIWNETCVHAVTAPHYYTLVQQNEDLDVVQSRTFRDDTRTVIVLDVCCIGDFLYVLLGDESLHQWIQVLDPDMNEAAVYEKPEEYATVLRMTADGQCIWLSETNTRQKRKQDLQPAYRIIRFDPDTGVFGKEIITLSNGYPKALRYDQKQNVLLITHEELSLEDAVWTMYDLDTDREEVFKLSDIGVDAAQLPVLPFAAAGSDGAWYYMADGFLYRIRMEEGIVKKWDLSRYNDLYPHAIVFKTKQTQ